MIDEVKILKYLKKALSRSAVVWNCESAKVVEILAKYLPVYSQIHR